MRKTVIIAIAALALISTAALSSCKKEYKGVTQFSARINNDAKTLIDDYNHLLWRAGDQIAIYGSDNTSQNGIFDATSISATTTLPAAKANFIYNNTGTAPNGNEFYAIYPASIAAGHNAITLPSVQTDMHEFPMYAVSSNTELTFNNLCGLLKLTLKATTNVSAIEITVGSNDPNISGTFTIGNDYTLSGGSSKTVKLESSNANGDNITFADGKDYYIYMPEGNYGGLQVKIIRKYSGGEEFTVKNMKAGQTLPISRGKYTPVTFTDDPSNNTDNWSFCPTDYSTTPGTLPGVFTVSATKKVYFSQGNLQFIGSETPHYWRFATNQWDVFPRGSLQYEYSYVPDVTPQVRYRFYENVDRDVFAYGTSNLEYNGTTYNPWESRTNSSLADADLRGTTLDWGANEIKNIGNTTTPTTQGGTWYTLTKDEWGYLIAHTGASHGYNNITNKRGGSGYGQAKINGRNGLVIFPDNYTCPSHIAVNIGWHGTANSDYTDITDYWPELASHGCLFLPSCGYSTNGDDETDVIRSRYFYYHTANIYGTSNNYCLYGVGAALNTTYNHGKLYRLPVRLVRDAPTSSNTIPSTTTK